MIGVNPRVDFFLAFMLISIVLFITYPIWVRAFYRLVRWWKEGVADAHDDMEDSESNSKRFKRRR